MPDRYPPLRPSCPHMLHGGDYNPDQWTPEIWDEDMRLMTLSGCNAMSVGIFSWAQLEPAEGEYDFAWLDRIMDMLADRDAFAVLATPSASQPAWMSAKYPEVLRAGADGRPRRHRARVNYCLTSPVYRAKVREMNVRLAERYKDHPALLLWHISNEYGGECHCDLCYDAFRQWLHAKYNTLDALNAAYWSAFWGHRYTDWSQLHPGDRSVHALRLDWMRFVTSQTIDFYRNEIAPLRRITPDVPITTNLMGIYPGLDYFRLARELDVASWDSYPFWHCPEGDEHVGARTAFLHDLTRGLKGGRPFLLMESVPSATNWMPVAKLKRPGMHLLSSLQAVAHGSDSVQYFQWRKGRGGSEKFHGAVVDHGGHENHRVFRDVADVGEALTRLDEVVGTTVRAETAVIYDWENRWAIEQSAALGHDLKQYPETVIAHYRALWQHGIPMDVLDQTCDLDGYKLVIAPMLHMLRPGMAERLRAFVEAGGVLVTTYWSGLVDENDLCFTGGWPGGGLREVLGIWDEETDALHPGEANRVVFEDGNALALAGEYPAREICALIHAESADVLARYGDDFYAGRPAVTVNAFGQGRAYYVAARCDAAFLGEFLGRVASEAGAGPILSGQVGQGVSVHARTDGEREFLFLMNFTAEPREADLGERTCHDLLAGEDVSGRVSLEPFGVRVLRRDIAPPAPAAGIEMWREEA